MKSLTEDKLFARCLAWLARMVLGHRRLFVYSQVVLFALSIFYTVKYLQFDMNRDDLVGRNRKYHKDYLAFKKEFPAQDDLVVVVQSEDPEKNREFIERLAAKLERETNLFEDVFYKGDLSMMGPKALLFVPTDDLKALKKRLEDYRPFIRQFTQTTNLASLFEMINTEFRTAKPEQNAQNESLVGALPAMERIINQADNCLHHPGTPPSPGISALFDGGSQAEDQEYIAFKNGQIFLLTTHAPSEDLNGPAVERLQKLVRQTRYEVPGINVGLTGGPVLEHDEMAQSKKDTLLASIVSLFLCALIFIYGYQETGRPIKATICLVIGMVYTLAFATLTVGHLNVLTITFVPMLIGLAIDFGVHLITRYEEELRHGRGEEAALIKAMVFTGQGIFTGAFTTAGAFLAMSLTNFKGIQEMGIICGGGLLVCLIPMMTLLPVLLLRGRQNVIDHEMGEVLDRRARIEQLWLRRPALVSIICVSLCVLALSQFHKIHFDYDLLHMQSEGLPAVHYEKLLLNSASNSVLYAAVVANSPQEAETLRRRIDKLPAVSHVESITRFLTENQTNKLPIIGEIKQELAPLKFQQPDPQPVNIPNLTRTLYSLYGYLGAALEEMPKDQKDLRQQFVSLRDSIVKFRKDMLQGSESAQEARVIKLTAFQRALFDDIRDTFQSLKHQDNQAPLTVNDLPPALRNRFVGVTGKYLLQVYPKKDIWNRQNQKEFISELRTIDPNVTGTPVQLYEYTSLLKNSYEEAAVYALAAIAFLVFIHFRSVGSVILALIPVAVGSTWLCGIMGFFGIPFNPANIMTLPLVIGIGVTNGIHILNRFAEEHTPGILAKSTGKAVLVSGLTTIAGFGSLILAKHRGIESLGYVMATGVAMCMMAGLTFLPALLNIFARRWSKNQPSADNAQSTLGREEPR